MHEVGMAYDIVELVDRYAASRGIPDVKTVNVVAGEYSGVIHESLNVGFTAARKQSERCRDASLHITTTPGRCVCNECGADFHVDAPGQPCPACGSHDWCYTSGREFKIASIEYEQA